MNSDYVVRDSKGIMVATIDQSVAYAIFSEVEGKRRPYHGSSGGTCFEVTRDSKFVLPFMVLYLWEGYIIR